MLNPISYFKVDFWYLEFPEQRVDGVAVTRKIKQFGASMILSSLIRRSTEDPLIGA